MNNSQLINTEESARLELYNEVNKGIQAIQEGKTKTAEEVRRHMEQRRARLD